MSWLRTDQILFTVLGYPMSGIEFAGTILNLWSVWLVVRKSVWTWPVGNVAAILFGILFYQIQLYSDMAEQAYFLVTSFYGWWIWIKMSRFTSGAEVASADVTRLSFRQNMFVLATMLAGSAGLGILTAHLHILWPRLFPIAASFPYLDAWTTVMSFIAQILMAHKKLECWVLWITVDVFGIGLYWAKGVVFVALLYVIFLILAVRGFAAWRAWIRSGPGPLQERNAAA